MAKDCFIFCKHKHTHRRCKDFIFYLNDFTSKQRLWAEFFSIPSYNHQRKISCTPRNFLKGNFTMLRVRLVPFVSAFDLPTSAHIDSAALHICPRMDGYYRWESERRRAPSTLRHTEKSSAHVWEDYFIFVLLLRQQQQQLDRGAGFDLWHMNQKLIRLCCQKSYSQGCHHQRLIN